MQTVIGTATSYRIEELLRASSQLTCAFGNILVSFSCATPDRDYFDRVVPAIHAYGKQYSAGMGLLVMISADEPPPSEAGRALIQEYFVAIKPCVRAGALVVEGEGFMASAKRSVITVLSMASSQTFPIKVAGNAHDGATKLAKMLGPALAPGLDPHMIATAANTVRSGFPQLMAAYAAAQSRS